MFKRNNNRENESKILLTALNHLEKIIKKIIIKITTDI